MGPTRILRVKPSDPARCIPLTSPCLLFSPIAVPSCSLLFPFTFSFASFFPSSLFVSSCFQVFFFDPWQDSEGSTHRGSTPSSLRSLPFSGLSLSRISSGPLRHRPRLSYLISNRPRNFHDRSSQVLRILVMFYYSSLNPPRGIQDRPPLCRPQRHCPPLLLASSGLPEPPWFLSSSRSPPFCLASAWSSCGSGSASRPSPTSPPPSPFTPPPLLRLPNLVCHLTPDPPPKPCVERSGNYVSNGVETTCQTEAFS